MYHQYHGRVAFTFYLVCFVFLLGVLYHLAHILILVFCFKMPMRRSTATSGKAVSGGKRTVVSNSTPKTRGQVAESTTQLTRRITRQGNTSQNQQTKPVASTIGNNAHEAIVDDDEESEDEDGSNEIDNPYEDKNDVMESVEDNLPEVSNNNKDNEVKDTEETASGSTKIVTVTENVKGAMLSSASMPTQSNTQDATATHEAKEPLVKVVIPVAAEPHSEGAVKRDVLGVSRPSVTYIHPFPKRFNNPDGSVSFMHGDGLIYNKYGALSSFHIQQNAQVLFPKKRSSEAVEFYQNNCSPKQQKGCNIATRKSAITSSCEKSRNSKED
jgi:hypothetical protein